MIFNGARRITTKKRPLVKEAFFLTEPKITSSIFDVPFRFVSFGIAFL